MEKGRSGAAVDGPAPGCFSNAVRFTHRFGGSLAAKFARLPSAGLIPAIEIGSGNGAFLRGPTVPYIHPGRFSSASTSGVTQSGLSRSPRRPETWPGRRGGSPPDDPRYVVA